MDNIQIYLVITKYLYLIYIFNVYKWYLKILENFIKIN